MLCGFLDPFAAFQNSHPMSFPESNEDEQLSKLDGVAPNCLPN